MKKSPFFIKKTTKILELPKKIIIFAPEKICNNGYIVPFRDMAKDLIINIKFNKLREPVYTLQNDDGNSVLDDTDPFNVTLSTTAKLVKFQNKTWDNGSMKLQNLKVYDYKEMAGEKRLVSTARYEIGKSFYLKLDEIPTTPENPARIDFMIVDFKHVNCSLSFNYYESTEKLLAATAEIPAIEEETDELDSLLLAAQKDTVVSVPVTVAEVEPADANTPGSGGFGWGILFLVIAAVLIAGIMLRGKVNKGLFRKFSNVSKVSKKSDDDAITLGPSKNSASEKPVAAIVMVDEPEAYSVPKPKPRPVVQSKPAPVVPKPAPVATTPAPAISKPAPVVVTPAPELKPEPKVVVNAPKIRCDKPLSQHKAFAEIAELLDKLLFESSHTSGNAYSNLLTHINMRYLNFRHQIEELRTPEESQNAILDQFGSPYNWICEVVRLTAYLKIDQAMRDMCTSVKLDHKMIELIYSNTVTMCEDYGVRLVVPVLFNDMYVRSRYIALESPLITRFIPNEFRQRANYPEETIYDVLQPGCIVSTGEVKLPVVCYIHDNNYK